MPVYEVTAPNGKIFELEGDSPPTEQELEDVFASMSGGASQPQDEQGFISASGETASYLGKSVASQSASGLQGLATGLRNNFAEGLRKQGFDDAASFIESDQDMNQAVESTLSKLSPSAPSERSQSQLQDVGGFIEKASDVIQKPVSGLMGLGELATGQGLDQASQTVQNVQQQGIGQTLGDRTLEETNNPELATAAYMSPDIAGSVLGLGGAQKVQQGAKMGRDIYETMPSSAATNAKQLKTADVRKAIQEGSKYYVDKKIDDTTGRVVDDEIAKKALKQNITDETIAHAKRLDKGTKTQAQRILNKGAEVLEYGEKGAGRPNAIIGERAMARFDTVLDANRKAGRDISNSVKTIENQSFVVPDLVDNWDDSLASLNITRDSKTGRLNFKGSAIEKDAVAPLIQMMDGRLKANYKAKDLHAEKQFIAKKLYNSQGEAKVKGGSLDAKGVQALEKLRDGMNQKLRDASPEYTDANDRYSETITTINDFQKVMGGKKFNPYSDRIDDTAGNEIRKVLTQYRSGQDMQEAIKNLNEVSAKYGGKYDDDIVELARFYDNFEREFKSFAQGSFPAQTRDAMKDTAANVAIDAATGSYIQAGRGAAKAVGSKVLKNEPTERTKIQAMKELLKETK